MNCHRKALNNANHSCYGIVQEHMCEPFRLRDLSRMNEVKVMFLGLSPGNPELKSKPYTPCKDASLKDIMEYIQKPIKKGYDTNYKNTMKERIGSELEYVKANVVHGILEKDSAQDCLETCGRKFLQRMMKLFCGLEHVVVYDFEDRRALNYVNKKFGISIDFRNSNAAKGFKKGKLTFIAAPRTRRYIKRLSETQF